MRIILKRLKERLIYALNCLNKAFICLSFELWFYATNKQTNNALV